jgi:hypothetical protein
MIHPSMKPHGETGPWSGYRVIRRYR